MGEEASSTTPSEGTQANIGGLDGTKDQPQDLQPQPELAPNPKPNQPIQSSETADTAAGSLTSPTSTQHIFASGSSSGPVPLDSPLRTTPIHPSLASVKIPATAVAGATEPNTNPITLRPFTDAELSKYGFEKLRAQITTRKPGSEVGGTTLDSGAASGAGRGKVNEEEIKKLRDETAALLKQKIDEREAKIREIEREMEEKEKIREVERKVFRKKLGGNAPATGSATIGPATTTTATATATAAGAMDS